MSSDGAARAADGRRAEDTARLTQRLFPRLVATFLLAFLPFSVLLTILLTRQASTAIEEVARRSVETTAGALGDRVDSYLKNRRHDVEQVALNLAGASPQSRSRALTDLDRVRGAYDFVALVSPSGRTIATSKSGASLPAAGSGWLASALARRPAIGTPTREGDTISLVVAAPVVEGGRVTGVVAGDLDMTRFWNFVQEARLSRSSDTLLVDDQQREIVAAADGPAPRDEATLLTRQALRERVDTPGARAGVGGASGSLADVTVNGRQYISGYAPVPAVGWAALVRQDRNEALDAVGDQRRLATVVLIFGLLTAVGLAYLFARQASRPLTAVARAARTVTSGDLRARVRTGGAAEVADLSTSFNRMVESLSALVQRIDESSADLATAAAELSAASEELAATTQEQSSAATETSATMEELARTFHSIADTVAGIADQSAETREVLEQAEASMHRSSDRSLALSQRVGEVSALVELINEIADQTNLLALNAAIEAARAGESGRGFTVVAEEVRRLAERSKSQAAEIGNIIEETRAETNATVLAMEQSSKLMRRGLDLMERVTEGTEQMRLTIAQQGAATDQVVDTMEAVSDTSRQTSATAQQISAAATQLTELVEVLRLAAASVEARRTEA